MTLINCMLYAVVRIACQIAFVVLDYRCIRRNLKHIMMMMMMMIIIIIIKIAGS